MQQVNLYQPIKRGPQGTLSSIATLRILALVAVALAGIWGFSLWEVSRLRKGVEAVRVQHDVQESLKASGLSQLNGLSQDQLDAHVASLTAALNVKTRALEQLRAEAQVHGASFAARLAGLARQHVDGIWLDHLTLGDTANALSLSGTTVNPALVPEYLRNLARDPALRGTQIDEFVIEQPSPKSPLPIANGLRFRASNQLVAPKPTDEET